jgi:hypothetical protein
VARQTGGTLRVLKKHLHPYKTPSVHELKEGEKFKHVEHRQWSANGENMLNVSFFTSESYFHLSIYVSSQNRLV